MAGTSGSKRPTLGVGILGAAAIAPSAVIEPARLVPGVEVSCVAARQISRAQTFARRHDIPRAVQGYEAVLDDPNVDAVYIPLPNGLHGTWTIRALEAGKHVLVEKPFAANAAEAQKVAEVAKGSGLVVMEAFHWRYHPLAKRVMALVAAGEIGAVRHIDAAFSFPLLKPGDIRWSAELAGGALMDAGCYPLHQIRSVGAAIGAGEPEVTSAKATFTSQGVDRQLTGELRFTNGVTANLACGLLRPSQPVAVHLNIEGDRGTIKAFNPILAHLGGHLRIHHRGRRRQEWFGSTTTYTYQLRAFVDAIRDGVAYPTNPADSVANMAIIDALFHAVGASPPQPTLTEPPPESRP